jgi:hypothetical protein
MGTSTVWAAEEVYFLAIAVLRRSRGGFMELTQVRKTKWK